MRITTQAVDKKEPSVALSAVEIGKVFRFATDTYEDALKAELFWHRVASTVHDKDGRCFVVAVSGKETRVFDGTHRVVVHDATMFIPPL